MIKAADLVFLTDGGETWTSFAGPFVCVPEGGEITLVEVEQAFASGSFSISGTLEVEVRNYQLEEMACWPVRIVEPAPYAAKDRPWLKRKKGRAGHGY